ncbi:MAG: isochorismatase family protein [Ancalomicrobiaceae bacterium]|nr:isochorismatase family protein [Ancalomicrobiaceae bacterium]
MTVTTLDRTTALVVVDLQQGIVAMLPAEQAADIVRRAGRLADAFRAAGLPVVLVNVAGMAPGRTDSQMRLALPLPDGWTDLASGLGHAQTDITVTKRSWGAFSTTDLATRLRDLGVTQIVLAGISTSIGVESTARQAYEVGLNVTLAVDAMADRVPTAHANSVGTIFPRLGEVGTTDDILTLLAARGA